MRIVAAFGAILLTLGPLSAQDLSGHGGPVRALSADAGGLIYSGSFDTRSIVWDGTVATRITRFHQGAVTAVLPLPNGRFASGGQDGQVAIWRDAPAPLTSEVLHPMPVGALAATDHGLASAGWDGRIALWDGDAAPRYIDAHQGQITGLVAYQAGLASVGADLKLRIWKSDGALASEVALLEPASALATDGTALFLASPAGSLRKVTADGTITQGAVSPKPLVSIAAHPRIVAVGGITGEVWLINPDTLEPIVTIETGQGPIWALVVSQDVLFTGGNDGLIRRWSLDGTALGQGGGFPDPTAVNPRGAQVFRACAVCHTLTPDDGARAGPTLHGIFGRRIGTAEGYQYSDALRQLDIVWTAQTISELFEFGPDAYTPGSRMPEQRVPNAEDRRALITYLEQVTR